MIPSIIFDYDPRNLPQPILSAIGLVAAASAQTENIVEMGIGGCLGVESDYSMAVTTHMNAPLRDNVLRSAAEIKIDDVDDLDELDELLDAVNAAFTKRNMYVHNSWCQHPTNGTVYIQTTVARGSVDSELVPITTAKISADATEIYDAGINLLKFLNRLNLLPPLPAARRERAHKTKAARKKRRKALLKG
jgi:hypothetical protein